MARTAIEEEVILLLAVWEQIHAMVNFEMLSLGGSDPNSEIRFSTMTHQKLFNILLVDFLSETDKRAPLKPTKYLDGVQATCAAPKFNGPIDVLRQATQDFVGWLFLEVEIPATWFPSINRETTLKMTRSKFLRMCGNISKHNSLRLGRVAKELEEVFTHSNCIISRDDCFLALGDFYERFHADILNYHASTIAEYLNNIRWGIYEYLEPEFRRSLVWESKDPPLCRYTYPQDVTSGFARACYWDLMNAVRTPPYMRRFTVTKWLKLRY